MFQILMRLNRYSAVTAAALAGMVLADKPLARLSFNEVCREVAGVDLEQAREKFWQEEQQRRRDEGPRR